MSVYTLFTCSFPEQVPELLPLGLHVALALPVRGRDERHPLGNLDVPVLQPPDLAGIVGEQPDFFHAELAEGRQGRRRACRSSRGRRGAGARSRTSSSRACPRSGIGSGCAPAPACPWRASP